MAQKVILQRCVHVLSFYNQWYILQVLCDAKKIISVSCTFLFIPDGSKLLEMLMQAAVHGCLDADAEKQNPI